MLTWLLVILAALVGLFYYLGSDPSIVQGLSGGELVYLLVFGALALFYIFGLAGDYRGRTAVALRHLGIWVAIGLVLVAGYAYRDDLAAVAERVAGEVLPPGHVLSVEPSSAGERAVRLRRHPDGHFLARGTVNGSILTLLVDTGASTVVLKSTDAEKIGIDTENLSFTTPVQTANGTTYAAPIRIKSISIGEIELKDVEGLVAKPGNLSENLLGMSFLKRLRSYEFSGDFLTLRG